MCWTKIKFEVNHGLTLPHTEVSMFSALHHSKIEWENSNMNFDIWQWKSKTVIWVKLIHCTIPLKVIGISHKYPSFLLHSKTSIVCIQYNQIPASWLLRFSVCSCCCMKSCLQRKWSSTVNSKAITSPPPSKLPLIVHNYNLGLTCPLEGKKYLCVCVYLPAILVTFQRKSTRPRFRINGIQQMILSWGEELEHKVITRRVSWLVSRDFELSQTLRIRSGLKMNFNPSLSYSSCKSQMQQ